MPTPSKTTRHHLHPGLQTDLRILCDFRGASRAQGEKCRVGGCDVEKYQITTGFNSERVKIIF